MTILGTVYIIDPTQIDLLIHNLSTNLSPATGIGPNRLLCMDMDETSDDLEKDFPDHCIKATLLCPPPIAMYKEIDGDQEGFIRAYNEYLEYDSSVQEFITSMLYFLHTGGNIILRIPAYLEDDPIWVHTLIIFFYSRFGITIGTSPQNPFNYDTNYDNVIITLLYQRKMVDVFDFINSNTNIFPNGFPAELYNQIVDDLMIFSGPNNDPMELYEFIKRNYLETGIPIIKPAIYFDN